MKAQNRSLGSVPTKAGKPQSRKRARAKALTHAPVVRDGVDGWQTPEAAGIAKPEDGKSVLKPGVSERLRYSETDGFYLLDKHRLCVLNGNHVGEFEPLKEIFDALRYEEASGKIRIAFKFGPRRRMVKRLTRTEAAEWFAKILRSDIPPCFLGDVSVTLTSEGRQP